MKSSFIRVWLGAVLVVATWVANAQGEDAPNQPVKPARALDGARPAESKPIASSSGTAASDRVASLDASDVHRAIQAAVALQSAAGGEANPLKRLAETRVAAERAADDKAAAEKLFQRTTAAVEAACEKASAASAAADKAAAEKDAAEQAIKKAGDEESEAKKNAVKQLVLKQSAARTATEKAAADKAAADKAIAEQTEAEKDLGQKGSALQAALASVAEAEVIAYGGLKPLAAESWDYAKARHLLSRAGFGGTPDEVARLHAMGLHEAVELLVGYREQPAHSLAFDPLLPDRPRPDDRFRTQQGPTSFQVKRRTFEQTQMRRLRDWWFQRMIQSQRPLQEKLTLFWHGHFATEFRTVRNSFAMYQQNELFRQHAAGNFGALLYGIIHDPAMLRYLDNNTNGKGKPNENLAREIMELFSMGEGQGYSEQDIMEAARALTGYTFDQSSGQFRFARARHDTDRKTVFGRSGDFAGEDFVDLILKQPPTARFIAGKLFEFFAYENPDSETVDALASVLRKREYELSAMLKNLFVSEEFYGPKAMGTQIKSPVQLVVGTFRELGVKEIDCKAFEEAVRRIGQDLFDPPNVKGWEGGRYWVNANSTLTRYNILAELVERTSAPGKSSRGFDVVAVLEGKCFESPGEVVDYFAKCLYAVPLASDKREEFTAFVNDLPPSSQWADRRDQVNAKLRGLLVLMLTTPEYQMT